MSQVSLSRRGFLLGQRAATAATAPDVVAQLAQIQPHCLAQQGVGCRTCGERCETGAIHFALRVGGAAQPVLAAERCTGCGDCLSDCPVRAVVLVPRVPAAMNPEL